MFNKLKTFYRTSPFVSLIALLLAFGLWLAVSYTTAMVLYLYVAANFPDVGGLFFFVVLALPFNIVFALWFKESLENHGWRFAERAKAMVKGWNKEIRDKHQK